MPSRAWKNCDERLRIFIVEKSPKMAQRIAQVCAARHHVVGLASSADEALDRLKDWAHSNPIDIAIVGDPIDGGLTARQLLELMKYLWPDVGCLYITPTNDICAARGADAIYYRSSEHDDELLLLIEALRERPWLPRTRCGSSLR